MKCSLNKKGARRAFAVTPWRNPIYETEIMTDVAKKA
jgi:hypothetical protein